MAGRAAHPSADGRGHSCNNAVNDDANTSGGDAANASGGSTDAGGTGLKEGAAIGHQRESRRMSAAKRSP